jgi:predicted MFS family arabinose efflux permease
MTIPLSRNRNFRLLWGSQALSEFGDNASSIAFPLLVLAVSGSPGAAGLVLSACAAVNIVVALPMGALADRWNRKKILLGCEAVQVVVGTGLVAALLWDAASLPVFVIAAAVLTVSGALFAPAEEACVANVVPDDQLSTAVAMNSARSFLAQVSGTTAGGFLFAIGTFVPFAVDVLTSAVSFVALMFLRLPQRETKPEPVRHLGREMAAGLRWVWRNRPVRVIEQCAMGLNLFFTAYFLVIIIVARARGISSGEIGIMAAMAGVGGFLGTLVAPYLHRKLRPYLSIVGVLWILTILTPIAVFISSGYVMGILFAAIAFFPPTANTTIMTYELLLTPDELRGRVNGVAGVVAGLSATVGPALGGFLMEVFSQGQAILLCTAGILAVTILATVSPTLRGYPRRPPLEEPQVTEEVLEQQA